MGRLIPHNVVGEKQIATPLTPPLLGLDIVPGSSVRGVGFKSGNGRGCGGPSSTGAPGMARSETGNHPPTVPPSSRGHELVLMGESRQRRDAPLCEDVEIAQLAPCDDVAHSSARRANRAENLLRTRRRTWRSCLFHSLQMDPCVEAVPRMRRAAYIHGRGVLI
jgi:hypothetical protein